MYYDCAIFQIHRYRDIRHIEAKISGNTIPICFCSAHHQLFGICQDNSFAHISKMFVWYTWNRTFRKENWKKFWKSEEIFVISFLHWKILFLAEIIFSPVCTHQWKRSRQKSRKVIRRCLRISMFWPPRLCHKDRNSDIPSKAWDHFSEAIRVFRLQCEVAASVWSSSIKVMRLHQCEVGSTVFVQLYINAAVILSWFKQTKPCQYDAYGVHTKYTLQRLRRATCTWVTQSKWPRGTQLGVTFVAAVAMDWWGDKDIDAAKSEFRLGCNVFCTQSSF